MKNSSRTLIILICLFIPFNNHIHGYFGRLPLELWYTIARFLPAHDPALRWLLTFLVLTDTQADIFVKNYHRETKGKNPLRFFGKHPAIKQAWLRFKKQRKAIKQALLNNDRDILSSYLEAEYRPLLIECSQAITPRQLISLKSGIGYALVSLKKYYNIVNYKQKNGISKDILKRTLQSMVFLSCIIYIVTTCITLSNDNQANNNLHNLMYTTCMNGTTIFNTDFNIYIQKEAACKEYAAHAHVPYNYRSLIIMTVCLLLLNSVLFFYIWRLSQQQNISDEIQQLVTYYYTEFTNYHSRIGQLGSAASRAET